MCVIFTLLPNQMIPEDKLECAVGNNLHGYGIIMHPPGKPSELTVTRGFDKDGVNPDDVFEILDHNRDLVRYVHLRNQTEGDINEDNVHPFEVFNDGKRVVYAMHNGTFYSYKPGQSDGRNDTRIFAERFLSPFLKQFEGQWGKGDYNDPLFREIMSKFTVNNRVLLISNDLDPGYFGEWKDIVGLDNDKFKASNDEYFHRIVRGPRMQQFPFRQVTGQSVSTTSGQKSTVSGVSSNSQVSPSLHKPESSEKTEEKIKTTGKDVINLSSIINVVPRFEPDLRLLKELGGYTAEIWYEHGFSMINWAKDQEIANFLNKAQDVDKVQLLRDLITTIEDQDEEIGQGEMRVIELEEEVRDLVEANSTHLREIERLKKLLSNNVEEEINQKEAA